MDSRKPLYDVRKGDKDGRRFAPPISYCASDKVASQRLHGHLAGSLILNDNAIKVEAALRSLGLFDHISKLSHGDFLSVLKFNSPPIGSAAKLIAQAPHVNASTCLALGTTGCLLIKKLPGIGRCL